MFFFFNDTATTEIYTLSLHDALPISRRYPRVHVEEDRIWVRDGNVYTSAGVSAGMDLALALIEEDLGADLALEVARRSEEHTSELQSLTNLVCRLLLEKKKKI